MLGLPFVFFYNIANGIFSALGDSKTPFYFLAASSVSNILVDIYFVNALNMGVAGVAWATFICQGISCILAVIVIFKRLKKIENDEQITYFDSQLLKQFLFIAIPSTLQQSFISLGNIFIQGIINSFGSAVMAGYSAAIKLNNLVITSFTTIGNGISNFTAQNLGASKVERVNAGFKAGVKMVWLLTIPLAILYFFYGEYFVNLFLDNPSNIALSTAVTLLKIVSPFYFLASLKLVSDGILRGSGLMKQFMTATFIDLFLRVAITYYLAKTSLGATGIWCSWPFGWFIGMYLSVYFYKKAPFHK